MNFHQVDVVGLEPLQRLANLQGGGEPLIPRQARQVRPAPKAWSLLSAWWIGADQPDAESTAAEWSNALWFNVARSLPILQTELSDSNMQKFSLRCFGVGDGWPCADRYHSAFLYRFAGDTCLIDCGEPITRSYKASGLPWDLIDRIFISHLHFDHVGGLFMLIQGFWLEGRTKELRIHAPSEAIAPLRQMLNAACVFDEVLPFRLKFEPLNAGVAIPCGGGAVTPFPTSHLAGLQKSFQAKYPQKFEAFSFLIERKGLRIGHSADLGTIDDLKPLVEGQLDLLVCELAHVPPAELFRFLHGRPIERFFFIHLAREWLAKLSEVESLAGQALGADRVGWPKDGEEFFFGPAECLA